MRSAAGFNKFLWLKALQADTSLTPAALLIGMAICISFTRADGTGWEFDLDQLDAELGGRTFTQNTIKAATALLVLRGYVTQIYRSKGGKGCRWRASFDLIPARSSVRVAPEPARSGVRVSDANPHDSTCKPARLSVQTRTISRTKNRAEQGEDPPTGTSSGTSSGGSARDREPATPTPAPSGDDPPEEHFDPLGDAAPSTAGPPPTDDELARAAKLPDVHPDDRPPFAEPEPSRHCPDHPNDTTDICPHCHRARNAFQAKHVDWQNRCKADKADAVENRKAWRAACRECDEAGWQFDADGVVPADQARRCRHPRQRAAHAVHQAKYTTPKPGKAAAS